ncbi:hypothetical protein AAVH_16401 [Aphelenchoides avenae]|nr:hypothetical protein AAVH_25956 [Aphelenchus avenae]KAH7716209.1 hypothetical protein AAVH_16401 [Aphelenchus avenae]
MHPVLFYEAFFFFSRDDLERLQPVSRTLRDMIVQNSNVLPLRPIRDVWMDSNRRPSSRGQIHVRVEWLDSGGAEKTDYEASLHEGDFAETVRRLNNTNITNFSVGIRDSPFMRYWKAQGAAACTVENILFRFPDATDYNILDSIMNHLRPLFLFGQPYMTDYDVLDSIVKHLRPRATAVIVNESSWRKNGWNSKKLALLSRDTFLKHLRTCWLGVRNAGGFPPSSFILSEPGYANYDLLCNYPGVAAGIDDLIESFIRDGCANRKLVSVSIKWNEQSFASKLLSKPTKADVPLPNLLMMMWIARNPHRVSQCEMHSFVNATQHQRLEVFKWTIEHEDDDRRRTTTLLQCRVKDL